MNAVRTADTPLALSHQQLCSCITVYSLQRSPSSSPRGQSVLKSHSLSRGIPGPWWQWYWPSRVTLGLGGGAGNKGRKIQKVFIYESVAR